MRNTKVVRIFEEKKNGKYIETFRDENAASVYEWLASDLISKKINGCTYIRSISRTPLYNGFQKITITYTNNVRNIFIVKN